jgi:DNA-binding PadR family transcriptional regulator
MHDFEHHRGRWSDRTSQAFHAMGRRGFGGFGGRGGPGWGDWGGFGDNIRIGRMMASGDLRLVALYFIEQQPRHGYDLIKAIEDKTGGLYVPSPGVVYPALTFLEEANYVTSNAEGNKRLYTITEEGRTHLNDNREAVESTLAYLGRIGEQFNRVRERWEEAGQGPGPDAPHDFRGPPPRRSRERDDERGNMSPEVDDARRALKQAIREAARQRDPQAERWLADVLRRAADEIRNGPPRHREPEIDI